MRQVTYGALDFEMVKQLEEVCFLSYTGMCTTDVVTALADKEIQLWQHGKGILTSKILQHRDGRELLIELVSGSGIVNDFKPVWEELQRFAKQYKCRWISGQTARSSFGRFLERKLKMQKVSSYYLVEI